MIKVKIGNFCLILTALIFIGTAIAHLSCIYFGPECYSAQLAPPQLVDLANNGSYLAPTLNIIVSTVFIVLGLYAFSAAGIVRKLPLLKIVIPSLIILCLIRGILPLQKWLRQPDSLNDTHVYYGIAWLITGLLLFFGSILSNKNKA